MRMKLYYICVYHRRCNLASNTGGGGGGSTGGIRNFNIGRSQVRQRGQIGLNQSLVYTHPFPPVHVPIFFICRSSTQ
jgi:hypothetical protein